jgi:hypothetical protein
LKIGAHKRRMYFVLPGLFLLILGSGCSQYVENYFYVPHPAMVGITGGPPQVQPPPPPQSAAPPQPPATQPAGNDLVTAYAMVVGVWRGPENAYFDPKTLSLLDGQLREFPAPVLRPPESIMLAPSQSAEVSAFFPFPAGRSYDTTNLQSLQVRWAIMIQGDRIEQGAEFHRIRPYRYYADPYWDYPPYYYGWGPGWGPGFGGGVVIIRRR